MLLTESQLQSARGALNQKIYLEGYAGTGKTTTGLERLSFLLESGVPANTILVWIPQRALALPYYQCLDRPNLAAGGQATVTTLGGLARHAVDLFWPLVAEEYGFRRPEHRPTFLTLETTLYFMARVVGPLIDEQGLFATVTISRNRLYSQIIDNLNKAAVVGFDHTEIGGRLQSAWNGAEAQLRMYDDVQTCANRFRDYCREHNLLDFSLQVELFRRRLWPLPEYRRYIQAYCQHLVADNIEEDTPAALVVLRDLLRAATSALIIYDTDAGYRRFLGADPDYAYRLREDCDQQVVFTESLVASAAMTALGAAMARSLDHPAAETTENPRLALAYANYRYHPEMIDGVAAAITDLVTGQHVPPGQIVALAPYLSDALRFGLLNRLQANGIPARSHRPSRALREEPAALCLLTLAQLAHPAWRSCPAAFDVVAMFLQAIDELDLVRAQLLAQHVYKTDGLLPHLAAFETIAAAIQERITYTFGERYDRLREWIDQYSAGEPAELDHFWSQVFGEVLSQPGFGFHHDFDAAATAANLIDSAAKFRRMIAETDTTPVNQSVAQEYVVLVGQGIIADQYLRGWDLDTAEAVLLAPAYTFLLSNRPAEYQFWLNVGGSGWAERLYQPLTNPYVLSLSWPERAKWTDAAEETVSREALYRLALGLIRRCRTQIYLGFSELGEQGYEQRGELLQATQRLLRGLGDR